LPVKFSCWIRVKKKEERMEVKTIAVIGAGTVGRGIACAAVTGGYHTKLEDVSPERLEESVAWIKRALDDGVLHGEVEASIRDEALSLISAAHSVEDAIRGADLIIEAVPDEMEMKLELFTLFDKFARPGAILASSSIVFSISEMTDVTTSQERCLGMRFPNSKPGGKLIEIVKTSLTSDETVASCREVARRMGREAVIVDESAFTIATRGIRPIEKPVSECKT
jgi:3-hydroxybutyryl-CoA dehydrogenase